ncbi:MAG: sigma-70 family RNA polymerase sigma factor [Clostridia bacterium]|nr:sigma-70 family RNA polymerase sigma factor [Clostridia bacterium]
MDAFTEIIKITERKLYIIAKSRLFLEDDVKDAVQETYLHVYKNLWQLREIEKFNSWITRILINNCNKMLRKKGNYVSSYEEIEVENFINDEDVFIEVDSNIDLFKLLECLNYDDRILIAMYYCNEFTSKEISEILHINDNTVRSRINRAKNIIKSKLSKEV